MFRPLKRITQQLSEDECKEILLNEPRGVLSVIGDDNYPYALPINFYYDATENKISLHSSSDNCCLIRFNGLNISCSNQRFKFENIII